MDVRDKSARTGRHGNLSQRWAQRLLRLYPRAWRERYGDEVAAVLAQHRVSLWTLLDMLLGAYDTHLHGDLLPGRLVSMAHRIRSSEIVVFCAFVVFCLAWGPMQQMRDPLSVWESTVQIHPEIRTALDVVNSAGLVALLAVLAGGIPILIGTIRAAASARRWDVLLLFTIPFVMVAIVVGYALLASGTWTQRVAPGSQDITPLAAALQLGFVGLCLLTVILSVGAVARVVSQSDVSDRVLRFALVPATVVTVALVGALAAVAALAALTISEAPQLGSPPTMGIVLALALAAVVLALAGLKRGWSAART